METLTAAVGPERPRRFAALKSRDCAIYLGGGALAMMADNIEHVVTYWVLWNTFHSSGLVAFEVISHWTPFLLGSVYAGALADRYDCRRVIQLAQSLFMLVSIGWAIAFATNTLSVPLACFFLVVHGIAGALWGPAEQLLLQDFVGRSELESAVRLNATARSLGILFGPVVGSALLFGLGQTHAMFANALIYLPLTGFLAITRYTGHSKDRGAVRPRLTLGAAVGVIRETSREPTLMAMVVVGGLGSFFIGASLQSIMPIFAESLGAGSKGFTYGVLLFATGAGGVVGGLSLELFRFLRPTVSAAVTSSLVYGASIGIFSITSSYPLAVAMLFLGGVANLAAMSISQTVVQLRAPPDKRGQVIGVYNMSANGLRVGSGFTVGLVAGLIGAHAALGLSSLALCLGVAVLIVYLRRRGVSQPVST